jgi:plastocyanin
MPRAPDLVDEGRLQPISHEIRRWSQCGVGINGRQPCSTLVKRCCTNDRAIGSMRMSFARAGVVPGLLGCATGVSLGVAVAATDDTAVKIDNFTFVPKSLLVKAGTTVTWTNQDDIPHTVASTTKQFKAKALDGAAP